MDSSFLPHLADGVVSVGVTVLTALTGRAANRYVASSRTAALATILTDAAGLAYSFMTKQSGVTMVTPALTNEAVGNGLQHALLAGGDIIAKLNVSQDVLTSTIEGKLGTLLARDPNVPAPGGAGPQLQVTGEIAHATGAGLKVALLAPGTKAEDVARQVVDALAKTPVTAVPQPALPNAPHPAAP